MAQVSALGLTPVTADLADFLTRFRPNGYTTFVGIVPDGSTVAETFNGADPGEAVAWIEAQNRARNCYFTANPTPAGLRKKPIKESIAEVAALWADIDPRDDAGHQWAEERKRLVALADELHALAVPPTFIVDSGSGIQPVWLLADPIEANNEYRQAAESLCSQIEAALGAKGTHNVDRLLRVPGTRNYPNAKKKQLGRGETQARLLRWTWRRYSWTEIERLAEGLRRTPPRHAVPVPPSKPRTNGRGSNDDLPPYPDKATIDALLSDPTAAAYWHQREIAAPVEDRSASGWDLAFAGYLARKGLGREEITALLRAYRAHHAPAKGKQDRTDYIFETVDKAIGGGGTENDTFNQNDNDLRNETERPGEAQQPAGLQGASIAPKRTDWLWHPYFPAGEVSLLGGRGGVGKGQAIASLTARLTKGMFWPDGAETAEAGTVLWAEAEDSLEKTVIPRLIANGADRKQFLFYTEEDFRSLDLGRAVRAHDARAVILSPIMSFLPKLKSHIDELAVRAELRKLRAAVDGSLCTLIGIAHLNKKTDLDAIERLLGSVAFANFVRSVVLLMTDKGRPDMCRWVHAKHNLSVRGADLLFRTVHIGEDPRDQFVKVEWEVSPDSIDVDSCFDRKNAQQSDRKPSAGEWLIAYLEEHGRSLATEVIEAGLRARFPKDTITKAQYREQRIDFVKEGFPAQVWWFLK
jgi:AAA domain